MARASSKKRTTKQPPLIELCGDYSIARASQLRDQLCDALSQHSVFQLNCEALDGVDCSTIQLLIAADRAVRQVSQANNEAKSSQREALVSSAHACLSEQLTIAGAEWLANANLVRPTETERSSEHAQTT